MAITEVVVRPKPAAIKSAGTREPAAQPKAWAGEDRYRMIAEAAYFRAERRGFAPGSELFDWLAAEIEVDEILGGDTGPH